MSVAVDGRRDNDGLPDRDTGVDDARTEPPAATPPPNLRAALRMARAEDAERSRAIADLQGVELARLEILKDRLAPVLAQIPDGADMFDAALTPLPRPRLFIDMIGFVEMAHDRRRYRFIQDRREGRVTLCESDRLEVVAEAVTAYIARRLIEREKALVGTDGPIPYAAPKASTDPRWWKRAGHVVLEYLGLASLVVLLWVFGRALYQWIVFG